ncbi:MAG: TIGR04282 family arsenosugar biosynthesis glycosyltransferase [Actinomycetota bacterium]
MKRVRTIIVIAKTPVPGRSKTRLSPPCTPEEAAALAAAALGDTLETVAASCASRRVIALEGKVGDWLPPGFEVIQQRGHGLDERLAAAFIDVAEPALLIGMDTPQLTEAILNDALATLDRTDAVLGSTVDGGFWAVGLKKPLAEAFVGVPMSTTETGSVQQRRLEGLGLQVTALPPMRDVDYISDASDVAAQAAHSHFAATLRALGLDLETSPA